MKVFYWSPFFSNIATIKAVLNSAESLIKYSKKDEYEVGIINSIGEWNPYKIISTNKIQFKDLNNTDISKSLPKGGFFKSRLSYFFIFFFNFFKFIIIFIHFFKFFIIYTWCLSQINLSIVLNCYFINFSVKNFKIFFFIIRNIKC